MSRPDVRSRFVAIPAGFVIADTTTAAPITPSSGSNDATRTVSSPVDAITSRSSSGPPGKNSANRGAFPQGAEETARSPAVARSKTWQVPEPRTKATSQRPVGSSSTSPRFAPSSSLVVAATVIAPSELRTRLVIVPLSSLATYACDPSTTICRGPEPGGRARRWTATSVDRVGPRSKRRTESAPRSAT